MKDNIKMNPKGICREAIDASSFAAKVRGDVFAHFQAFAVKLHSNMRIK
jgi:hypothetical protein